MAVTSMVVCNCVLPYVQVTDSITAYVKARATARLTYDHCLTESGFRISTWPFSIRLVFSEHLQKDHAPIIPELTVISRIYRPSLRNNSPLAFVWRRRLAAFFGRQINRLQSLPDVRLCMARRTTTNQRVLRARFLTVLPDIRSTRRSDARTSCGSPGIECAAPVLGQP